MEYINKFLEKNPEDMNLKTRTIMFQCFMLFSMCLCTTEKALTISCLFYKIHTNTTQYINFIPNLIIKKISLVRK